MEQKQAVTEDELNARIMALINQRNSAMDQAAALMGRVTFLENRIKQLEELIKPKIASDSQS